MLRRSLASRSGFTLIEIICVLVLLAIIASVAMARMVALDANASRQMLRSCMSELNSRENLAWCQAKLSPVGWVDDAGVFVQVGTSLGSDYQWSGAPTVAGGVIRFKDQVLTLDRESSSNMRAGFWKERP
jgi:prepilin-type N-terminal cleavage/methylation domain-containing protein